MSGLIETDIPADVLPRVREWFAKELARLEKLHGPDWANNREWLIDYMNAEVRERVQARANHDGARA